MKAFAGLVMRALLIVMVFASIGIVVNQAADNPFLGCYAPAERDSSGRRQGATH